MNGKHLTDSERFYIEKRLSEGVSQAAIARELNVARSTLSREIRRNTDPDFNGLYSSRRAQTLTELRRRKAASTRTFRGLTPDVLTFIHEQLAVHTSPEVISGVLRLKTGTVASKNLIYRYIQHDRRRGGGLYRQLPHQGKRYRYSADGAVRIPIRNRTGIELRPAEADLKLVPGHFEIDTIFGKDQASFLVTLTDKATRSTIIRKMTDKRAESMVQVLRQIVASTLYEFKTITSDNGPEFANHEEIAQLTGAEFFFARPYHSWERGLNEHTNGLIRRIYPKGTDFNDVSDEDIAKLEHMLNVRGRKSLGYYSPNEVFLAHLMAA